MGKKATYEKARQRQVRQGRDQRSRKSAAARATRRGDDSARRLIQRTAQRREPVTAAKRALLLEQFPQACRLPQAGDDLCALLRSATAAAAHVPSDSDVAAAAAASRKRPRGKMDNNTNNNNNNNNEKDTDKSALDGLGIIDAVVDAFLQLEHQAATADENEEEPMTLLEDVIQDESGSRVVCALIEAATATKSAKAPAVLDAVAKVFEESETLHEHFVACKVMSTLVQHGDCATQKRALRVLQHHATSTEQLEALLRNRHTAVTIRHLLDHHSEETVVWITDALGMALGKKAEKPQEARSGKSRKSESTCNSRALVALVLDPVAAPLMRTLLLRSASRAAFLAGMNMAELLESKRGCKFLQEILSHEVQDWTSEEAGSTLDVINALCETKLVDMCTSSVENFVVQSIIALTLRTKDSTARFKRMLQVIGAHLPELARHAIGVHVVIALATAALSLPTYAVAEEIAGKIITRNNVTDILCDTHGSLAVRKLLPLCAVKDSKVGQLLISAIEQDISTLTYDAVGNLTVQEFIKTRGAEGLARKLVKSDELLHMCRHPYASHVVGCLFDHVNATTHAALCHTLKPHTIALSRHLNGRFVIEKAINANREIRDLLLQHFSALAIEKGTQHVLCTLVANLDQRNKKQVRDTIVANLVDFSTHQCSSILLQKLMQNDSFILQAVHEELKQKPRMRNELAQNFYGKFVVQISGVTMA